MAIIFRSALTLFMTCVLTGCRQSGASAFPRATVVSLASSSIAAPPQAWAPSSMSLVRHPDGSLSVYSARPATLPIQGLDPSLVNPDLLPFLFPSCDY